MRNITNYRLTIKGSVMKVCAIVALLLSFFSFNAKAQIFYTETFDGTACAATSGCDPSLVSWTTTSLAGNGGNANKFYVSCISSFAFKAFCKSEKVIK